MIISNLTVATNLYETSCSGHQKRKKNIFNKVYEYVAIIEISQAWTQKRQTSQHTRCSRVMNFHEP